jgi:hypothetical protein
MKNKECEICGNDHTIHTYYEIDGKTLCDECVMDLCQRECSLEENSFTTYHLGGDYIGDENDDINNIIETALEYKGIEFKKLESELNE